MKLTAILAMTADGKISDRQRTRATFTSSADKEHLQKRVAELDAIILGAQTLRSYGSTITVPSSEWQPINIIVSRSGQIPAQLPFFRQPVPRWLLTTSTGAQLWQSKYPEAFERLFVAEDCEINWLTFFSQLTELDICKIGVLGGGKLVASLLAMNLIDEFWLTICPVILGGESAPTPVDGLGLPSPQLLELLSVTQVGQELFLHYKFIKTR